MEGRKVIRGRGNIILLQEYMQKLTLIPRCATIKVVVVVVVTITQWNTIKTGSHHNFIAMYLSSYSIRLTWGSIYTGFKLR